MDTTLIDVIRGRRTVGSFQPDVPPTDLIDAALDAARWAPNHKKTEPWRVYCLGPQAAASVVDLNSRMIEKKKGLPEAQAKRKSWSAVPGWLVVTCLCTEDAFRQQEDYAACCCFIQNLMLVLWSAGVGTKWSTGDVTREPEFFQLLGIDPAKETVVGLVWYGYPALVPEQSRQPLDAFRFHRA